MPHGQAAGPHTGLPWHAARLQARSRRPLPGVDTRWDPREDMRHCACHCMNCAHACFDCADDRWLDLALLTCRMP